MFFEYKDYKISLDRSCTSGLMYLVGGNEYRTDIICNPDTLERVRMWIDNLEKEKLKSEYGKEFDTKLMDIIDV